MIRKATKNDLPAILQLIRELAIYEKEPDAVETTIADLERDGFGDKPYFQCEVCDVDGDIVGMALYFYTWSTWTGRPSLYLEDLFVRESERGKGYGMELFKRMAQIALEKNCRRFEWAVLDWNQPARDFYHSFGGFHREEWLPYRLEGDALKALAEFSK